MKRYIKYIALFIILVLVGFVSLNFYNNSKLDNNFKASETTKNTENTTKKDKEKTSQETSNDKKENKTTSQEKTEKKEENSSETKKPEESKTDNSNSNSNSSANNTESTNNSKTEENSSNTTSPKIQRKSSVTYRYDSETQSTNTTQNNPSAEVSQDSTNNSNINNEAEINVIDVEPITNAETVTDVEEDDEEDEEEPQIIAGTIIYSDTTTSEKNKNETNNTNNSSQKKNNANKKKNNTNSTSQKKNNATSNSQSKNNNNQVSNKKLTSTNTTIKDGKIVGATGYSALNGKKYLRSEPSNSSAAIVVLKGGSPFKILATKNNDTWWKVQYKGKVGYVENAYCMINLPDYIPSITYRITNASKSIYKSSGEKLSVTGTQLYKTGKVYNERLEKNQYIVPVVYSFAKKILAAQKTALSEGYSLKIYDAYRPTSVSTEIKNSLQSLYASNATVRNNINYASNGSYWGQSWFLAQNLSAHNVASAIDVTLTKKGSAKSLKMPTKVHELSTAAIKYKNGVSGQTTVRNDLYISSMNENAKKLDSIMLKAGLTNLASEWWHFQDNEAYGRIKAYEPVGLNFQPTKIVSTK